MGECEREDCCQHCEKESSCIKMVKRCLNGCDKCTACPDHAEPDFQSGLTLLRKQYARNR